MNDMVLPQDEAALLSQARAQLQADDDAGMVGVQSLTAGRLLVRRAAAA